MDLGNPSCRFPICSNRLIPVLATTVASRHGGCSYSDRHGRTTLVRRDNAMAKDSETIESVQQGVAVYDPQGVRHAHASARFSPIQYRLWVAPEP